MLADGMSPNMAPPLLSRFLPAVFAKRERGLALLLFVSFVFIAHSSRLQPARELKALQWWCAYFWVCLFFKALSLAVHGLMMVSLGET